MDRMSRPNRVSGLTLIELMIALVVLAILVSLGSPLMQSTVHRNRLLGESARFLHAINLARSEAVMRNVPVSICPSAMAAGGEAVCSGVYTNGWVVFANAGRDKIIEAGADEVLQVFAGLPAGYWLSNRSGSRDAADLINYLPDGSSHKNNTLQFCPPEHSPVESLSIVINIVGRARLAWGWGQCAGA